MVDHSYRLIFQKLTRAQKRYLSTRYSDKELCAE